MKTMLLCLLCSTLIQSTEAAYKSFRVVELAPMQFPIEDLTNGDSTVLNAGIGESMSLSFTCNRNQRYIIWASEKLEPATWIPIKQVTPGVDTPMSPIDGEDVATVVLPKPFMSHWISGHGFVRVSIPQPEAPIANEDWVPIQGLVNNGTHITVTFKSEALREYIIEGADSPVATNWTPVDIYWYENSIDHIKIPSQGSVTSVDISNPMLPWIPVDGGWLRIRRVPVSAPVSSVSLKGPIAMASTLPSNIWYLVCTRSGTNDPWSKGRKLGVILGAGGMSLMVGGIGPRLGWASKYQTIQAYCTSSAVDHGFPYVGPTDHRSVQIPDQINTDGRLTTIKTMVALSRYVGGEEPPTVIYLPPVNPSDKQDGRLQTHLEIRESTVIAVSCWDNPSPLKDGISLEPVGVGFKIDVGGNYPLSVQMCWQFNAMNVDMYDAFTRMLLGN